MERGAYDLHMMQLMPLPPHIPWFIKIRMVLLLVLAYSGCRGKDTLNGCVSVCLMLLTSKACRYYLKSKNTLHKYIICYID